MRIVFSLGAGRVLRPSTLSLLAGAVLAILRVVERVEVTGDSMRPTLVPGDRLLVVRGRFAMIRPGDVVTVADPRQPARILVKRVAAVADTGVMVCGDNPGASTDSRHIGPVRRVRARAVYRYSPRARAGRLPRPGGQVPSPRWPT